jgi:hypothetical protein
MAHWTRLEFSDIIPPNGPTSARYGRSRGTAHPALKIQETPAASYHFLYLRLERRLSAETKGIE